jgi:hypothetical protein
MLLPPSAGEPDMGNDSFRMSDFTNYSTGQGYGPHQNPAVPQFFASSNDMDVNDNWATADLPTFTAPFAVRSVDPNSLLPFRQQPMNREGLSQHFYPPFMYQERQNSTFGMPMNAAQPRPRTRRSQLDSLSTSDADFLRSPTPQSAERHESRRTSITDQMFQSFVMSPTSSVLSMSQRASIAESDFTEQSSFNK